MRLKILFVTIVFLVCFSPFYSFGLEWKCMEGDCQNGYGTSVNSAGSQYTGEFKDGILSGQGTLVTSKGKFAGKFNDGKLDGQGAFVYPEGKYTGEFKDGLQNGQGTLATPKGRYVDGFKKGKPHCQGQTT